MGQGHGGFVRLNDLHSVTGFHWKAAVITYREDNASQIDIAQVMIEDLHFEYDYLHWIHADHYVKVRSGNRTVTKFQSIELELTWNKVLWDLCAV
jgi:hypothetical protein